MNEKEPASCKYCGWKIPPDLIQIQSESHQYLCCEYCGSELSMDEYIQSSEGSNTQPETPSKPNKKQKFRSFLRNLYEKLPYEKNPIIRVARDSDFSENFKQNFIIVMARLLYPHIRHIIGNSVADKPELTKSIIDRLFEKINPIFHMRIDTVYLTNLHKISIKEFEGWFKKLQAKLRISKNFHRDFVIYLRLLIREVFVIITEIRDIEISSKFEKVILIDLRMFYRSHFAQDFPSFTPSSFRRIKGRKMSEIERSKLMGPWSVVDFYYEKVGFCRRSLDSSIIRHNFLPVKLSTGNMKLICKYCGYELINNDISGIKREKRALLWDEDQNKEKGDITIYLISWHKDQNDNWLPFPGLFYSGQSKKTAKKRIYGSGGHFAKAFSNPKMAIEYTIKKYGLNPERAQRLFKVHVLQIVRFQGTNKLTQELANKIESFWIGFFHSQFYEFGRNIEPGGSHVHKSIIISFEKLDKALYKASKLPRVGDINRKKYVYNKLGMKETQNRILDNSIEFWYGFTDARFESAIRFQRFNAIKRLFEKGYKAHYISNEINADRHDIVNWVEEIYSDKYKELGYKKIRKAVLSEIIINYVSEGHITPESLLTVLPGFQNTEAIKHLIRTELGGWNNLIDNYALKEDYWIIAKKLLEQREKDIQKGKATDYTVVEFAQALGSTTTFSSAAIKYIRRKLKTNLGWNKLKDSILTKRLP
ncbi:MAG: hypothetical protein ACFFBI_11800 [Promethearchaeota archaeon]